MQNKINIYISHKHILHIYSRKFILCVHKFQVLLENFDTSGNLQTQINFLLNICIILN
jgi:hypothetical protein